MIAPFPRTPSRSLCILISLYLHVSIYPHISTSQYPHIFLSVNLEDDLLILLHCLSEVDNLAVLLLQHILEVAHRRVGGRGGGGELLVDGRRRAFERLAVPREQVESAPLLLINAVAARKAIRLRTRPC